MAHSAIESLDVCVLLGLACLDIVDPDLPSRRPALYRTADVFRPVVTSNGGGLTPPFDDLLQNANHPLGGQREIDFDAQCFPVEVVDHIQQPEASTISELVVHEVHRPHLVDGRRHSQRLGLVSNPAFSRLDPQIQLKLPVNSIHALVVPAIATDIAQIEVAQAKPQLRWLSVSRINQRAISSFSALRLAL